MRDFSSGNLLTFYRDHWSWTQKEVAEKLKIGERTYQGWENGERIPPKTKLQQIVGLFHLTDDEADALYHAASQVAPKLQNLPFPRNRFFTGRESYLERLDQHLKEKGSVAITQTISISGLGGIGKTQIALEYAHRSHPTVYRSVLWVNAADKAALEAGYLSLAGLLKLPEKNEHEVDLIVQAVKTWLEEHTNWLLILDNADDLQLARSFLPTEPRGHILLTTRSQIVGNIAPRIDVEAMEPEEGLSYLLRRSGILKEGAEQDTVTAEIRDEARQLVEILGGYPLALDQAGAYIDETGDSFATYIQLYSDQRLMLLNERGSLGDEHPEPVAVTFEICFQQARELYSTAADVLHFCSFLHPDNIPEELLSYGLKLSTTMFNNAMRALRRYSLIKRDTENKLLSVHRLVQAVLKDGMEKETSSVWAERTILAVNTAFPHVDHGAWMQCERLLPHALLAAQYIETDQIVSEEAGRLLHETGSYLRGSARYAEAEPLCLRALAIREQQLGPEHPQVADSLFNLGLLFYVQRKYAEAEPLYLRSLAIREQQLGLAHPQVAYPLHGLALLYSTQGKYAEAKPLYQRALNIREHTLGSQHPETAEVMHDLALLLEAQGNREEAKALYARALAVRVQAFEAHHPKIMETRICLISLLHAMGQHEEAAQIEQGTSEEEA